MDYGLLNPRSRFFGTFHCIRRMTLIIDMIITKSMSR